MEETDYSNLSIKQLRLFLAIFDTGSVNGAANQLNVNQSTVSYSLDRLRDAFGDSLFVKSGRGIVPTEKTRTLAPQIREILMAMEGLHVEDTYSSATDTTPITIAANVATLQPYCKAIHDKLAFQAPNAEIRFIELGSRDNIAQLLDSQIVDLTIAIRPVSLPKSLCSVPLMSFEQCCYYDSDRRGPVENIAEYCEAEHAVLDFGGSSKSTIDNTLEAMSITRNIKLRVPDITTLSTMMKGTKLIATMQSDLGKHVMSNLSQCPAPLTTPELNLDLIWHRRSDYSVRDQWLRNSIRDCVINFENEFVEKSH